MESKWKAKALAYYRDGLKISEIATLLEVSRQSVSGYLKSHPDYASIKQKREAESKTRRRAYKTKKQVEYRAQKSYMAVTPETVRREHELAVMELSREKYH